MFCAVALIYQCGGTGSRALCVGRLVVLFPLFPTLCSPLCISVTGARLPGGVRAYIGWVVRFCQPSVQSPSILGARSQ